MRETLCAIVNSQFCKAEYMKMSLLLIVWLIAYCGIGIFFELSKIITAPAYFSLYGGIMFLVLATAFRLIDES